MEKGEEGSGSELALLDERAIRRLEEWGGGEFPRKMITIVLSNSPARMEEIRSGLAAGDAKVVEAGSHSLKSSAGNVGAVRLQKLLLEMELSAAEGNLQGLRDRLPLLEETFEATCEALRTMMEGLSE